MLAYWSLCSSASIPWPEFDIDKTVVVSDLESNVTGRMLYIKDDYSLEDAIKTVPIKHTDGAGIYQPGSKIIPENLQGKNIMMRGPGNKGLFSPFDFLKFCKIHNVEPVLKDRWGQSHNLIEEDIQIIIFDSQFKLAKLYKSHQEFKDNFKRCGCQFVIAQFEEDEPPDKTMNYQFVQALQDFTDEEIQQFTKETHDRILNLAINKKAMLWTLKAKPNSLNQDKVALHLYPELLRDGYNREQLKDIKRRMLFDAKSGAIRCKNKRLYVLPDWYAVCEYLFLGIKQPKGLLANGEIACKPYLEYDKADVLRSPSLYMEHAVRTIVKNPEIYEWLCSDGIYTSVHDLISRILQFDQWSN